MRALYKYEWDEAEKKFVEVQISGVSSEQKSPAVIQDTWDPTLNHCDGKVYDSRSKYYQAAKEAGCIEVDKDELLQTIGKRDQERRARAIAGLADPNKLRDTIERLWYERRDGRRPAPEAPPAEMVAQWRRLNEG